MHEEKEWEQVVETQDFQIWLVIACQPRQLYIPSLSCGDHFSHFKSHAREEGEEQAVFSLSFNLGFWLEIKSDTQKETRKWNEEKNITAPTYE